MGKGKKSQSKKEPMDLYPFVVVPILFHRKRNQQAIITCYRSAAPSPPCFALLTGAEDRYEYRIWDGRVVGSKANFHLNAGFWPCYCRPKLGITFRNWPGGEE